ncbi:MAG: class I SAM-dependent methyltransferase, partial [Roseovarius sp.]|nr:class I SAM-dependent methyltransferase [Roseovarius sp.]
MTEPTDTRHRIVAILQQIGARDLLDIGCGHGALAKSLLRDGFRVTGIDPSAEAIVAATARVPGATFVTASAEALPFAPGSFDAAIFLNSLHHVPVPAMQTALQEA